MIFISIIISPSILILHILFCNLFYKSEKKILFMFLSFKLYILIFFILITFFGYYQFNLEFISSLSIIFLGRYEPTPVIKILSINLLFTKIIKKKFYFLNPL